MIRYRGRELAVDQCISCLKSKGCVYIPPTENDTSRYLDISSARGIGKASWGMIDFMRGQGIYIVGKHDYFEKDQGG